MLCKVFNALTLVILLSVVNGGLMIRLSGMPSSKVNSPTRFLTTGTTAEGGDEERVVVEKEEEWSTKFAQWLAEETHPEKVLNLMQIVPKSGSAEDLFNHPNFATWLDYVKKYSAEYPTDFESGFSTLGRLYSDDQITTAINSLQSALKTVLEKDWTSYKSHVSQNYEHFLSTEAIHRRNFFTLWTEYMTQFNAGRTSGRKTSMSRLIRYKIDDPKILKKAATVIAEEIGDNQELAKTVKADIFNAWLSLGVTPDKALASLELDNPFMEPFYQLWIDYANAYNADFNLKMKPARALVSCYKPAKLVDSLYLAKESDSLDVKNAGSRFEHEVRAQWIAQGISPEDLYRALNLNGQLTWKFQFWILYLNSVSATFGKDFGKEKLLMCINAFPEDSFPILQAAWAHRSMKEYAGQLLVMVAPYYTQHNILPEKAFTVFQLHTIGDKLLFNPLFATWLKYSIKYPKNHPKWFDILKASYDEDQIRQMIEKGQSSPEIKDIVQEVKVALTTHGVKSSMEEPKTKALDTNVMKAKDAKVT